MAEKLIKTIYCWIRGGHGHCQIRSQSNASHLSRYPVSIKLAFCSKMIIVWQIRKAYLITLHLNCVIIYAYSSCWTVDGSVEMKTLNRIMILSGLFLLLRLLFFFFLLKSAQTLIRVTQLRKCDKKHVQSKIYLCLQKWASQKRETLTGGEKEVLQLLGI